MSAQCYEKVRWVLCGLQGRLTTCSVPILLYSIDQRPASIHKKGKQRLSFKRNLPWNLWLPLIHHMGSLHRCLDHHMGSFTVTESCAREQGCLGVGSQEGHSFRLDWDSWQMHKTPRLPLSIHSKPSLAPSDPRLPSLDDPKSSLWFRTHSSEPSASF